MTTYVERELIRRRVYKRHQIIDKVKNFILCYGLRNSVRIYLRRLGGYHFISVDGWCDKWHLKLFRSV